MASKDKKAALVIAFGGKPKKPDEPTPEDDSGVELETAMSELSTALKSGDSKAAALAFKSAVELCGGY